MLRLRLSRPGSGSMRSALPTDPAALAEALAEPRPAGRASTSRRRRAGGRLLGFGAAVVLLGQCGNSCTPTTTTGGAGTSGTPAAAAATTPAGTGSGNTGNGQPNMDAAGVFRVIAPGGQLPSDEACAAAVRANPSPENRPRNVPYNNTPWHSIPGFYERATGNFTGSTDDIIRWAACKWGFDEDVLRAQVVRESYWHQRTLGDWTTDASRCAPGHGIGVDGRAGQCPESVGLMQVRGPYLPGSIVGATASSAYNLDVALAVWRSCYDGEETWLNNVERGRTYAAGDAWGCVGRWLAGRWYTAAALTYIGEVQTLLAQRAWTTTIFVNAT